MQQIVYSTWSLIYPISAYIFIEQYVVKLSCDAITLSGIVTAVAWKGPTTMI